MKNEDYEQLEKLSDSELFDYITEKDSSQKNGLQCISLKFEETKLLLLLQNHQLLQHGLQLSLPAYLQL